MKNHIRNILLESMVTIGSDTEITLYHGTSSVFLGQIKKRGLVAVNPRQYVIKSMSDIEKELDISIPSSVREYILGKTNSFKRLDATDNAGVFLARDFDVAKSYATSYSKEGGELRMMIFHALVECKDQFEEPIEDIVFDHLEKVSAYPIVVEVHVPLCSVIEDPDNRYSYISRQTIYPKHISSIIKLRSYESTPFYI